MGCPKKSRTCAKCGMNFRSSYYFEKHERGDGGPDLKCPEPGCLYISKSKSCIERHRDSHRPDIRCPDPGCFFMSKHESSIKRHMARHGLKSKPKDKPYEYKPKLQRPREDNNLMNVPDNTSNVPDRDPVASYIADSSETMNTSSFPNDIQAGRIPAHIENRSQTRQPYTPPATTPQQPILTSRAGYNLANGNITPSPIAGKSLAAYTLNTDQTMWGLQNDILGFCRHGVPPGECAICKWG